MQCEGLKAYLIDSIYNVNTQLRASHSEEICLEIIPT